MKVEVSGYSRCVDSAEAFLEALYPRSKRDSYFEIQMNVHDKDKDPVFKPPHVCPYMRELEKEEKATEEMV